MKLKISISKTETGNLNLKEKVDQSGLRDLPKKYTFEPPASAKTEERKDIPEYAALLDELLYSRWSEIELLD